MKTVVCSKSAVISLVAFFQDDKFDGENEQLREVGKITM